MIGWFYPQTDVHFQLSILNYLRKLFFLKNQFSLVVMSSLEFEEELRSHLHSGPWIYRKISSFRRFDIHRFIAGQKDLERCVARFELSLSNCFESSMLLKMWYSMVAGLSIGFAENDSHSRIPRIELAVTEQFVKNWNFIGPWPANRISKQSHIRFEFSA